MTELKWESVLSILLERYSKWLSAYRTSKHAAFCRVCERVILLTTMGIKAVDSHMKSEKHRKSIATSDKKVNSITNYVSVGGASATPSAASSSKATSDIRSTFSSTETLKAELLWTLQTVAKHQSYHSNDDIGALFTLMFPDSATAQGFSCGENKTAYPVPGKVWIRSIHQAEAVL